MPQGGNTKAPEVQLPCLREERFCEWQAARRRLEEVARGVTSRRGLFGLLAVSVAVARLRAEQARLDELIAGYERQSAPMTTGKEKAAAVLTTPAAA
ncbi:MAG TPA: hypothetical protein VNM48_18390 [Chloroflexota bacterium]|nr:hypothetical protein [Chloroflexota bacterium]